MKRRSVNRAQAALLACVAAAGLVGCGRGAHVSATEPPLPAQAPIDPIINTAAFGEQNGLEIRWWAMRDDPELIRRALAPYLHQPAPTDPETVERLRQAGLRLVAVPMADLLGLRARMPIVGRIERRWIGQAPRWIECVPGPRFSPGKTVRIGQERLTLRPGALRLLTRAWTEPQHDGATLRIDLAMQHVEARHLDPHVPLMELPARHGVLSDGMVFAISIAELESRGVHFYLLVPEPPEIEWGGRESDDDADATGPEIHGPPTPEPEDWTLEPEVDEALMQGPPAPDIPTLGEAMLIQPEQHGGARRMRAIIVLIPRLAGETRLLP